MGVATSRDPLQVPQEKLKLESSNFSHK